MFVGGATAPATWEVVWVVGAHGNRGTMRQRGRCFDGCVATVIKPERSINERPELDVVIRSPK